MAALVDPADAGALARLRIAKLKAKHGVIERVGRDGRTAICRGMFKKETDLSMFRGMKVLCPVRLDHCLQTMRCVINIVRSDRLRHLFCCWYGYSMAAVIAHGVLMAFRSSVQVSTAAGEIGTIEGHFGKSGKFSVHFPAGLREDMSATPISLVFKKLMFSPDKRVMMQ